jgi:hypothetical protein
MLGDHPHHPLTHRGLNLLRHLHILLNSERCGMKPRAVHRDIRRSLKRALARRLYRRIQAATRPAAAFNGLAHAA